MAFEWELDFRLIYTDGAPHPTDGNDYWMGDSRGHWEGDTLVVDVLSNNDKTWFDMAGDFHSEALHVAERYRMTGRDTIQYEATIEDSKVFTKPWTMSIALHRRTDRDRLFEYDCESEKEEVNGAFEREERTWYPGSRTAPPIAMEGSTRTPATPPQTVPNLRRTLDGKPDLQGFYESRAGRQPRRSGGRTPGGRSAPADDRIVDPPDGKLPMQAWAMEERASRNLAERGYDDPTAHCFPQGVPRSCMSRRGSRSSKHPITSSPARARVLAHRPVRRGSLIFPTRCVCGRAFRPS